VLLVLELGRRQVAKYGADALTDLNVVEKLTDALVGIVEIPVFSEMRHSSQ
jgi:hypothetical protein